MNAFNNFHILNIGYILELHERFLRAPSSLDPSMRAYFEQWSPPEEGVTVSVEDAFDFEKIVAAVNLAQAIRRFGHKSAKLDPLGQASPGDRVLDPKTYKLSDEDLRRLPAGIIGGPIAERSPNALDAINALSSVYSSTIGYDFGHVHISEERDWLRYAAEYGAYRPPQFPINTHSLLEMLTKVEVFEQFLHRFFPGKTRFSIEGLDMLVPILDEIICFAADEDICMVMIGMAHRGRLNVLTHTLSKPYGEILAEFKDPTGSYTTMDQTGWTGDVKYHKGASRAVVGEETIKVVVVMPPNPSHLEHINPVLVGMARAADSGVNKPGSPVFYPSAALPILIHGDASFPAEGIVAETLNLSHLPGYHTAGTIHIIANNQLGYTTPPHQGRSTLYASDLAKGFEIPILHVNADDPQACIEAARMAFAYRTKFHKDFLIDLIGYRRYGHNEGDEPGFTQPGLYEKIAEHPTVRKQLAKRMVDDEKSIQEDFPDQLVNDHMRLLQDTLEKLNPEEELVIPQLEVPSPDLIQNIDTSVSTEILRELIDTLLHVPDDFRLNRKLERSIQRRKKMLQNIDEASIDWTTAENLAFASILQDGIPIRLTGQDVERGTFGQRHAVFHDVADGSTYVPLQSFPQSKASFEIHNSPLSENAALGFEYGYSIQARKHLVIWEAQYGDFINAAQAIVDEFIVSGRSKWGLRSSLVVLLPHGYEGQGPNHSSGKLERFLQMATENNIRIANCTNSAQYFHLLRRQAKLVVEHPLPLVIFTPKSLLRHPRIASSLRSLSEARFFPVIDDEIPEGERDKVNRIILCSGKVAIDLLESEERPSNQNVAIVRIEQLSPFPISEIQSTIDRYPNIDEICWLQEEPENMGAWWYLYPRLSKIFDGELPIRYMGRSASPSPAEGSFAWHSLNQQTLISKAFSGKEDIVYVNVFQQEE
jgi:2-oxoglutarate dehydrogenase E1 component